MIVGLEREAIAENWDQLVELLKLPLRRTDSGRCYTADDVLWKCVEGAWQCWVAKEGAEIEAIFITFIESYPTSYKTLTIYLVGGKGLRKWLRAAWAIAKVFAKSHGCQTITGLGREEWLQALQKVEKASFKRHLRFTVEI